MLCVPAVMELVLQGAVLVLGAPVGSATAPHPLIVVPPSVNATVPVGDVPVTVAVKVTLAPATEGFAELASVVELVVTLLTTCDSVELVEPLLALSPP